MLLQQGDVLFHAVETVPAGKKCGAILVEGEHTGHHHALATMEGNIVVEENGVKYITTRDGVTIVHPEHKPVTLPPGKYRIGIVKEWDYDAEEIRNVKD